MQGLYQRNIPRFLVLSIIRGAAVGPGVVLWVIFLQQYHGLSLTQVTILDLPFWIGKFLFEIPTGIIADRYGRRLSLAVSATLSSLTWVVFAVTNSFFVLAAAQVFGAFAATFSSGADEALLFESVKKAGRESEYPKLAGRMRAVETASAMVSGLLAGLIASVNLLAPVLLTSVLLAAMLIPILSMKETGGDQAGGDSPQPGYGVILRQAIQALRAHPVLRWAAAYLVVLGCLSFYLAVFLQPYAIQLGFSIASLGPITVMVQLMNIAGGLLVSRAQRRFGNGLVLIGAPLLITVSMLAAGAFRVPPTLVFVAPAAFLFALTQPILLAALQSRVPDSARATLLSIQSLLSTVFLTVTEPGLGVLADRFGVHAAYLGMGAMMVLFILPLLAAGRRWLAPGQQEADPSF